MKKIKSIIGVIACVCIIIINLMVNIENKSGSIELSVFGLNAIAVVDPESPPPMNQFESGAFECPPGSFHLTGRTCRPVTSGLVNCTVMLCS